MVEQNNMKRVLVLDGEQRSSLAVVRALGEKEIPVIVGSNMHSSLAGNSKYCLAQGKYRSPLTNLFFFLEDIQRIIHLHDINIVVPCTDITSSALLKGEDVLHPQIIIMAAPPEQYFAASDKIKLIERACKLAIPCPHSNVICGIEEWKKLSLKEKFPVIFKPRASVLIKNNKLFTTAVKVVQNYEEGVHLIHNDPGFSVPFIVQQKIDGQGIGVFALFDKGQPVAFFSHRRLREKPPWGGVSVLCESAEPDTHALEYARKILADLKYHGVAMVEFKREKETGVPYLMEINARFWGSLQLTVQAGVNFPYLFYRLICGQSVGQSIDNTSVRLRWLLGDLDSLIISFRNKEGPFVRENMTSKGALLKEFLFEFFRKTNYQVFRWSDSAPFLLELREYVKTLVLGR